MAMKEYELAAVSEGPNDDEFFGTSMGAANGSAGIDAGQRMLLEGELKIDGEQGAGGSEGGSGSGSGSGLKDEEPTVWCGVLSIRFYQQFFDVDTADVLERWLHSFLSLKRETTFLDLVGDNPDAYGPFWNATSLVFLIALSSNLRGSGHDVSKLVTSAWLVYAFAIVAPVVLWVAFNQLGIPVKLIQMICTYGYSLGPYLPAVILCSIPVPYLSVISLGAAAIISMVFLMRTFTRILVDKSVGLVPPVMAGLGFLQGLLVLVLLLMFFA